MTNLRHCQVQFLSQLSCLNKLSGISRTISSHYSFTSHPYYSSYVKQTTSKSFLLQGAQTVYKSLELTSTTFDNMSTNNPSVPAPIIQFYDPDLQGKDFKGRTLSQILSWDDAKLETCHDYIQTLFPLPEPSPFNSSAPAIDREVFDAFRSRPELRAQLRKSLERMLHFYGFRITLNGADMEEVAIAPPLRTFDDRPWLGKFNHNHLRITRILRCLRVLGLNKEARLFFRILKNVGHSTKRGKHLIGEESMQYWRRAAKRSLYLAPDDPIDEGRGRDFLYEYEKSRNIDTQSRIKRDDFHHDFFYGSEYDMAEKAQKAQRFMGSAEDRRELLRLDRPYDPLYDVEDTKASADKGEPESHTDEATSTSNDDDAGEDEAQKPNSEKTQTSEVPATLSNSYGFSNQDSAKASNILGSAAGSSKRKIEDSDDDLSN